MVKYTDEHIMSVINSCESMKQFRTKHKKIYDAARHRWGAEKARELLPVQTRKGRCKYTKEECAAEALKYNTRMDFKRGNESMYECASYHKWLDDVCAHMKPKGVHPNSHTKEECAEVAKKYMRRIDFVHNDKNIYGYSAKHGWLDEICAHMDKVGNCYIIHTKEECHQAALKYEYRGDFQKHDKLLYQHARRKGWLDEICAHMKKKGNRNKRLIYAAEFADKHAYIGLTQDTRKRWRDHANDEASAVCRHIQKTGLQPTFKVIHDYVYKDDASKLEDEYIEKYQREGWTMLNTTKGGALGGRVRIWTLEYTLERAKPYKTLKEFLHNDNVAYNAALKHGWMAEVRKMLKGERVFHSHEEARQVARTCKTRSQLYYEHPSLYAYILRHEELKKEIFDMIPSTKRILNDELAIEEAKKYKTRTELSIHDETVYHYIIQNPELEAIATAHMPPKRITRKAIKNTKENALHYASICVNMSQFMRVYLSLYRKAKKEGYLDECRKVIGTNVDNKD